MLITNIGINSEPDSIVIGPALKPPIASAVPSATPNRITGKAQRMSMIRARIPSTQPRKYPASRPAMIERIVVISAAESPIMRELRPP